jgi:hypothetical protein
VLVCEQMSMNQCCKVQRSIYMMIIYLFRCFSSIYVSQILVGMSLHKVKNMHCGELEIGIELILMAKKKMKTVI